MENIGFNIYLLFMSSWFLHLAERMKFLGVIRFDFILLSILTVIAIIKRKKENDNTYHTSRYLMYLIIYIVISIPFVEWPGSVIRFGLENFAKAVVFYYFTISFVDTREKLIKFLTVFLGCQAFRVLEPVYLHLTEGYWGSVASMKGWEYLNRLSGAPSDVINPNGLANIILNIIPFFYYFARLNKKTLLLSIGILPICLYALSLTGSRSGIIGMFVIVIAIIAKSRRKWLLALLFIFTVVIAYSQLNADMKDRYTSLIDPTSKNSATMEGRIEGISIDFKVAMRRPLFGHGLGTSREANANYGGEDKLSHTLYTEILQELGIFGLIIFLLFIWSIIINYKENSAVFSKMAGEDKFIVSVNNVIQVWFIMNIIFSFASYGLSGYDWYLFSGLSVTMRKLTVNI